MSKSITGPYTKHPDNLFLQDTLSQFGCMDKAWPQSDVDIRLKYYGQKIEQILSIPAVGWKINQQVFIARKILEMESMIEVLIGASML